MKRLSIVLGTVGLLAGCGQILGLGDYEVGEETAGAGGTGGTTGGISGNGGGGSGGDAGNGGGANGGSAGAPDGGSAGVGTVTTTAGGGNAGNAGNAGMGGGGTTGTTTTTGMGGSAGDSGCQCDQRDPCLMSACEDGQCVDSPQPLGTECISGNFSGVCNDEQACVPCVDDAPDTEVDSGCPETAPECDDSGATPECTGCMEDIDCDDGVECTADTCDDGRCMRAVLPTGAECDAGVCNGEGVADSCVPCVDNQPSGLDAGCEAALPLCDATQLPAACVECLVQADCDDENECTSETCESNACVSDTVPAGEECLGGICSGIAGMESCGACLDTASGDEVDQGCAADAPVCDMAQVPPVCTGCTDNTDCDDEIDCTTDTCDGSQVCVHTPDDGLCEASGDVCNPNQCVPGVGCAPVNVTETSQLLADASFDTGGLVWTEYSYLYPQIIYVEYNLTPVAVSPTKLAWLGGGPTELGLLYQPITVPEGTQSLTLTFYYFLRSDDAPYYPEHSTVGAQLVSGDGNTVLHDFLVLGNGDENNEWEQFEATVDASAWAGSEVLMVFWAEIGPDLYNYPSYVYPYYYPYSYGWTEFFVDSTALTATVCQ